ncbi:MAG TPA: mechanosensitive ion channel domain-containing protein [Allosphingosinicella sp.]|jgi:small-conductance mechanosensitive channel|nr:mechanosensitive ion channel domain-containing protein [Allosphingosinicella sp.]
MNQSDSLGGQAQRLWADMAAWLSSHYLQILLGLIAGAVIVALLLGVRWIGTRICGTDPTHTHWRTVIGRILAGTRLWFMIAVAARMVAGYSLAPEAVAATVAVFFTLALTLQVALWVRELVLGVIEHRAGGLEESSGLGSAIGIIRLLVTIAIFAVATIVVLDNLNVNVTGLVAGLGIGGIAIGLAAQGIFADLFSALSIIFDKPFRRGDSIRWDTTSGTVEQIGLKTTRVRSLTGEEVVISNTNLLGKELHNMARLNRRRLTQKFGLIYQTSPEVCGRIPEIVKEVVSSCEKCVFLRCGMTGYGDSSLDFSFEFDVKSEVWQKVFEARHQVLVALLKRFNDEKIEFAYPTQTAFTAAPDGTLIMPYPPDATSTNATETR